MKKIIGLGLAALMMVGLVSLTACGNNIERVNARRATEREETGIVIMGTNPEFPPFEFISGGRVIGIDVAIAEAIAERMGKTLVIESMEFGSLLMALNNGTVDFVAAGMTIRPDRLESVDFSIPYYRAMQAIIISENNTAIQNAADLQNVSVGAVAGYTGYIISRDTLRLPDLNAYSSPAMAIAALNQGSVDAVVLDITTARVLVHQNPGLRIVMDEPAFGSEYYGIAVRQGDSAVMDVVNEVLQELIDSGELDAIIDYYIARMEQQ